MIAAPKSGSTWLSRILENLLGWQQVLLIPSHYRREQEIDIRKLVIESAHENIFSPGQHCRASEPTFKILRKARIKIFMQYRNIYDTVISVYDHFDANPVVPYAYMDVDNWSKLDAEEKTNFVIDMVIPWFFNFYAGWLQSNLVKNNQIFLSSYESLQQDPCEHVKKLTEWFGENFTDTEIAEAIEKTSKGKTRKNKGIIGRGRALKPYQKERIGRMAAYYPDIDFSLIGIGKERPFNLTLF